MDKVLVDIAYSAVDNNGVLVGMTNKRFVSDGDYLADLAAIMETVAAHYDNGKNLIDVMNELK